MYFHNIILGSKTSFVEIGIIYLRVVEHLIGIQAQRSTPMMAIARQIASQFSNKRSDFSLSYPTQISSTLVAKT